MPAETIDEVVSELSRIVDSARMQADCAGYFAALYRRVTVAVKAGIAKGEFEDGARMTRLDVIFANRYLAAWSSYRTGEPPSRCWRVAFDATRQRRPIILQHLLLGMNAHINLDLGVAAAQAAPGDALASLKTDFDRINQILASLVDVVQDEIDVLSPALGLLDRVGGRDDEAVVNFSIDKARDAAWALASELARHPASSWAHTINRRDAEIAALGRLIEHPGCLVSLALRWIRVRESSDVRHNIDALTAGER